MATFLQCLRDQVQLFPDKKLYTWVDDYGNEVDSFTYSEFDNATTHIASILMSPKYGLQLQKDTPVLLVYPPGLDFIVAFIACLKAGLLAVPVYPPRPGFSKDLIMFVSIQKDCGAKIVLTNTGYNHAVKLDKFKSLIAIKKQVWPDLKWIVADFRGNLPDKSATLSLENPAPDSLAFLQYTSGSTLDPKGVMVTHGNLGHNLSTVIKALDANNNTFVVSWLPCYHDMGLIGSLLGVAYCGGSGVYMSPVSFIRNPVMWLTLVTKYCATHLQAPSFAFKLVVRKFEQLKPSKKKDIVLDLSSVHHIFNGAEPIELDGMDKFFGVFEVYNLKRTAMSPGYGLAEHTVYVCDRGELRILVDKDALEKERKIIVKKTFRGFSNPSCEHVVGFRWLMSCGIPHRNKGSGIRVRIVDDKTLKLLPDESVGEIWVDSPSKALGYFGKIDQTTAAFQASISMYDGEMERNEWLRTGDLGFMHKEELFVCGRIKDLVIIRGRNHYPQDIEHCAEQADVRIRPGCVAAFSVSDSFGKGEHLGIVAEVRSKNIKLPELEEISKIVCQNVGIEHGIVPYALVLIAERTIPKTTSGKISRYRAKAAYENGQLKQLHGFVDDDHKAQTQSAIENHETIAELEFEEGDRTDTADIRSGVDLFPKDSTASQQRISGDSLKSALQEEVARLMEDDPLKVDTKIALVKLGMDSVTLTQFKGILRDTYGVDIPEIELFDEETTLETVQQKIDVDSGSVYASTKTAASTNPNQPPAITRPAPKPRQRSQKLFSCFKICGL